MLVLDNNWDILIKLVEFYNWKIGTPYEEYSNIMLSVASLIIHLDIGLEVFQSCGNIEC